MPPANTECALPVTPVAQRLHTALHRLLDEPDYDGDTDLIGLGLDSLTLLQVIALSADDLDREIDPVELDRVETVRDLYELLAGWATNG